MKHLVFLILIYLNNSVDKFLYNIPVIKYDSNNETPFFWKLDDKNITNVFTLTFWFKITKYIPDDPTYLIFLGYNNIEVNNIKTNYNKYLKNHYVNINGNLKDDLIIEENLYYYISWEINKINILTNNYIINMKLTQGNYSNSYEQSHTKIDQYNIEFNKLFIAFGLKHILEKKVYPNCIIENIKLYNRALTSEELNGISLGDSEALLFLNFSDSLAYSQYFPNKINNGFLGGINGSYLTSDSNDIFSEYIRTKTGIKKKFYLFDNKSYIQLSQNIIKYWHKFGNINFLVYFKLNIHLNNISNDLTKLDLDYNWYNRENKTGIYAKLVILNSFHFKYSTEIKFLNNIHGVFCNTRYELSKIQYLVLKYRDIGKKYEIYGEIFLKYYGNRSLGWYFPKSLFWPTDNHYIGNTSSTNYNYKLNYILIEIEEFMIGKGTFINKINNNEYYDNIVIFCKDIDSNKIDRINFNSCNERLETFPINKNNCEIIDNSGNCIFKYPEVNETVNSNIIDISRPYRQIFNKDPIFDFNNNNNVSNSKIYLSNYYILNHGLIFLNNNLVVEVAIIVTNDIIGNIFEINLNGISYSKFVINKNNNIQKFTVEIENSSKLIKPLIKIINLTNTNIFTIQSVKLLEINYDNIEPRATKFIGEKINNYYQLLVNKEYALDSINKKNYRKSNGFLIKCSGDCDKCNGPLNSDCKTCKNNYLMYKSKSCTFIYAKNCKSYSNPFYCLECKEGSYKNINNNICELCNSICLTCTGPKITDCLKCKNKNKYVSNITNRCELCDKSNNMVLNGKCYLCDNLNNIFLKKECWNCNAIYFNNCIKCNNKKYLLESNKSCVSSCPEKTYKTIINTFYYCKNCYYGCNECFDGKYNTCLSCIDNFYYNRSTKECKNNCDTGYFEKDTKNCTICKSKCLECKKNICNFSCEINNYINFINNINWDLDWNIYAKYSFYEKILNCKYFILINYNEETHNELTNNNRNLFKLKINKDYLLDFKLFLDLKFKIILIIPIMNENMFRIIKNIIIYIDLNIFFKVKKCNIRNKIIFAENIIKNIYKSELKKKIEKKYPILNKNTIKYKNIEITSKISKYTSDTLFYSSIFYSFFDSSILSNFSIYFPTLIYFKYLFLINVNFDKDINTIADFFDFNSDVIDLSKYISINKKIFEIRLIKQLNYNPKLMRIIIINIYIITTKYIFLNIVLAVYTLLKIIKYICLLIIKKIIDYYTLKKNKLIHITDIQNRRINNWEKKFKFRLYHFKTNNFFLKIESFLFKYFISFWTVEVSNIIFITLLYLSSINFKFLQFDEMIINIIISYNFLLIIFYIYYVKKIINLNKENIENNLTNILIPYSLKSKFSIISYFKIIEIIRNSISLLIILYLNYNVLLQIIFLILLQIWYLIYILKSFAKKSTIILLTLKEIFLFLFLFINLLVTLSIFNIFIKIVSIFIVIMIIIISFIEFMLIILKKYYLIIKKVIVFVKLKIKNKNKKNRNKVKDIRIKKNNKVKDILEEKKDQEIN